MDQLKNQPPLEKLQFAIEDPIIRSLCAADPKLALLIRKVGDYSLPLRTNYFASLVRSIIGQQLSVKVAQTIWNRLLSLCQDITPGAIIALGEAELKLAGLSRSKAVYLKDLSQQVANGVMDLEDIDSHSNDAVIQQLVKVKGIGVWTAEMFLIFSLGRLDVLSLGDLGLKRAIQWLYAFKKIPADRTLLACGRKWAPYRTVASLYLWEVINRGLIKNSPAEVFSEYLSAAVTC